MHDHPPMVRRVKGELVGFSDGVERSVQLHGEKVEPQVWNERRQSRKPSETRPGRDAQKEKASRRARVQVGRRFRSILWFTSKSLWVGGRCASSEDRSRWALCRSRIVGGGDLRRLSRQICDILDSISGRCRREVNATYLVRDEPDQETWLDARHLGGHLTIRRTPFVAVSLGGRGAEGGEVHIDGVEADQAADPAGDGAVEPVEREQGPPEHPTLVTRVHVQRTDPWPSVGRARPDRRLT